MATSSTHSPGFVLHSYPYRETSVIVEAFTRAQGRMVFVAKGAKRPNGTMRGLLNPFQGLTLAWFGKGDMKTIKGVEHARIFAQLRGEALMSAFYLNEIVLKLTHREDPHEALFDAYEQAIADLSLTGLGDSRRIEVILRSFELTLLQELGYALPIREEADTRAPIRPGSHYLYRHERGVIALDHANGHGTGWHASDALQLHGKTLLDLLARDFSDPVTLQQAKQLMRAAINALLGEKSLHTRQLIRELRDI